MSASKCITNRLQIPLLILGEFNNSLFAWYGNVPLWQPASLKAVCCHVNYWREAFAKFSNFLWYLFFYGNKQFLLLPSCNVFLIVVGRPWCHLMQMSYFRENFTISLFQGLLFQNMSTDFMRHAKGSFFVSNFVFWISKNHFWFLLLKHFTQIFGRDGRWFEEYVRLNNNNGAMA